MNAIRTAYADRIGDLLDLYAEPPLEPLGIGPLLPEPVKRPPYDELYLKQRYDRDLWSRNG